MNESNNQDILITEYQVVNSWRNNASNIDFIITSICMPLSLVIFSAFLTIKEPVIFLRVTFAIMSCGLIGFWRYYAHWVIDKKILELYPRICELEIMFEISFTLQYLESNGFIKENILNARWSFCNKYFSRGHGVLNGIAIFIFLGELGVYIFV